MSSYERLATDVDATEEAELRRLEGGAAARTCRRQHDTGADHETGACTASDAAAAADSGVDGSAFAHAAGHAAPPLLGAVEGKVLAPRLRESNSLPCREHLQVQVESRCGRSSGALPCRKRTAGDRVIQLEQGSQLELPSCSLP